MIVFKNSQNVIIIKIKNYNDTNYKIMKLSKYKNNTCYSLKVIIHN